MSYQSEITSLDEDEIKEYLRLQAKVGWRRTGTQVFESFFPILPMVPSELAVVRKIDDADSVLMWHRSDEHYTGWHMPGGYLLLGESDEKWVRRVLKKEADLALTHFYQIRTFNTRPETGWVPNHQMAHFFWCETEGEPTSGKFFPLTDLPEDTLGHHKQYIECLRAHIIRKQVMGRGLIRYDHRAKAPAGKWRVCEEKLLKERSQLDHGHDFDTLYEALLYIHEESVIAVCLIDDQGLQIC
jgi:ADP-ribose pyrophosphatase YjhB (NUDIX family)